MGGGDLNQKKSWHPNTFKNQERVWKAEQNEAAEKRKLAELQAEINAERDREDLRRVGQSSGVLASDANKKLEWMYRGPKENINREDYLLGRTVDKTFEQLAEEERAEEREKHLGVSVPKNHVEHECVPFSIRAYKNADPTTAQVDMARKMAEDPLMLIKQREMESRKKLLENPVKLKELKQLLQSEKGSSSKSKSKRESKKKKKEKKSKKSKKKRKRSKSESSDSSSSDSSDGDVDNALLAMLSKQRAAAEEDVDVEDLNFEEMVELKYKTLNRELDKMIQGSSSEEEEKDQRRDNRRNGRSGRSASADRYKRRRSDSRERGRGASRRRDRYDDDDDDRGRRNRDRSPVVNRRKDDTDGDHRRKERRDRNRSRSPDRRSDNKRVEENQRRRRSPSREKPMRRRERSESREKPRRKERSHSRDKSRRKDRSPSREKASRRKSSPSRDKQSRKQRSETRKKTPTDRRRSPSASPSASPSPPKMKRPLDMDSDDEERLRKLAATRSFGLVTAAGESIALKNSAKSYAERSANKQPKDAPKSSSSSSSASRPKTERRPQLTAEEKEQRLREMMKDAEWRDKERESYVRKYHADGRQEEDKQREEEFDKNFIHKELHKSAQSETVESRLKSNRNNIQRSSGAMNTNFARR